MGATTPSIPFTSHVVQASTKVPQNPSMDQAIEVQPTTQAVVEPVVASSTEGLASRTTVTLDVGLAATALEKTVTTWYNHFL